MQPIRDDKRAIIVGEIDLSVGEIGKAGGEIEKAVGEIEKAGGDIEAASSESVVAADTDERRGITAVRAKEEQGDRGKPAQNWSITRR